MARGDPVGCPTRRIVRVLRPRQHPVHHRTPGPGLGLCDGGDHRHLRHDELLERMMPVWDIEESVPTEGPTSPGNPGTAYFYKQGSAKTSGTYFDTEGNATFNGSVTMPSGLTFTGVTLANPVAGQVRITPSANAPASSSTGGALNVTNTGSTGAGIVAYTEQAAPAGHMMVVRVNSATYNQSGI